MENLAIIQKYQNNMLIESILLALIGASTMILWLETDVVYEYASLIFKNAFKDYENFVEPNFHGNFIRFLAFTKNNFFTRLLACPYCLGFWLTLFISAFTSLIYFGLIYFVILVSYFVVIKLSK